MFKTLEFLNTHFGDPRGVLTACDNAYVEAPRIEAVRKWWQRETIPGEWFPILVGVAERERGKPISMLQYFSI